MIGSRIAHYRIDAEMGRGGMGVVYRARDERLERDVAIKVLSLDESNHARILAEARSAAALNHPGIVTVYEVGEAGEHVFLVMELLGGRSLRGRLAEGALTPRELARVGSQVAEALAAAHARGIVHGDVKPENVALSTGEHAKILDFGIARMSAEAVVTQTRSLPSGEIEARPGLSGTLAYMSPELLRGEPTDARSDLFSFGVMLYELVAGTRPFNAPTGAMLAAQILHEAPPPLSSVVNSVPVELERIIHKLLEKDPRSRYQSARDVQVDLANLLRDLELGHALPPAMTGKRAVAVLPFTLLSPDAEDEYLSVALADTIIQQLSSSGDVLVRPTSMVRRYANRAADPRLAARELNVQVIIEGSIQKAGQRLRVHVQAWDAAAGATFLSAKHDGEMSQLFELQDSIAGELRGIFELEGAINRELAAGGQRKPAHASERPTREPLAYELFLRGAEKLSRATHWETRSAIEMLENAVKLDPKFADAWARLGEGYLQLGLHFEPGPKWVHKAEQNIKHALRLDPGNSEAHCSRGQMLFTPFKRFQMRTALHALDAALRLNEANMRAWRYRSAILFHVGLHDEAREDLAHVFALNPEDGYSVSTAGHISLYEGKYQEAADFYARALRAEPSNIFAHIFSPVAHLYAGNLERAREKIASARQVVGPDPMVLSCEALLWALRGERKKAEKIIQRALRIGKSLLHTHHAIHNGAVVYALIGKKPQSTALLRKAMQTGLPNFPLFRDDPHLRALDGFAPYRRLLVDLEREWAKYRREFGRKGKPNP